MSARQLRGRLPGRGSISEGLGVLTGGTSQHVPRRWEGMTSKHGRRRWSADRGKVGSGARLCRAPFRERGMGVLRGSGQWLWDDQNRAVRVGLGGAGETGRESRRPGVPRSLAWHTWQETTRVWTESRVSAGYQSRSACSVCKGDSGQRNLQAAVTWLPYSSCP